MADPNDGLSRALIQLLFADIDGDSFPKPLPDILPRFTRTGIVDAGFVPKPALAMWDQLHRRRLEP